MNAPRGPDYDSVDLNLPDPMLGRHSISSRCCAALNTASAASSKSYGSGQEEKVISGETDSVNIGVPMIVGVRSTFDNFTVDVWTIELEC